jgi:hypothetical protein
MSKLPPKTQKLPPLNVALSMLFNEPRGISKVIDQKVVKIVCTTEALEITIGDDKTIIDISKRTMVKYNLVYLETFLKYVEHRYHHVIYWLRKVLLGPPMCIYLEGYRFKSCLLEYFATKPAVCIENRRYEMVIESNLSGVVGKNYLLFIVKQSIDDNLDSTYQIDKIPGEELATVNNTDELLKLITRRGYITKLYYDACCTMLQRMSNEQRLKLAND